MSKVTHYVLGFALEAGRPYPWGAVLLIRKQRPEWQRGFLNGLGGHVETGETALEAIRREFREEAGGMVEKWTHQVVLKDVEHDAHVDVFHAFLARADLEMLAQFQPPGGESLQLHVVEYALRTQRCIPNLAWLIPIQYARDMVPPVIVWGS